MFRFLISAFLFPIRLLLYYLWLAKEIVWSSIKIVFVIFTKEESTIKVLRKELELPQNESFMRILYANSITLTPGTITISLKNESVEVCMIEEGAIYDLKKMRRMVSRIN